MKRAVPLLLISLAIVLVSSEAGACTCERAGPPCEAVWAAPIVFTGEVIDITPVPNQNGPQFMRERRVRFRVEQMWRGAKAAELEVMTGAGGGDCGYDFERGGRYLVYTYAHRGVPWTGICSRTQRLSTATEDLQYLAGLESVSTGGRVFGFASFSRGSGTRRSQPAAGYVVTLRREGRAWTTKTDAAGGYEFSSVQAGTYGISIDLQPGERVYADKTVEVREGRGCGYRDFSLVGAGTVTFRVLSRFREPAAGIRLEIIDADTLTESLPSYRHAVSGADGVIHFTELPPGRYLVASNFRLPPSESQPFSRALCILPSNGCSDPHRCLHTPPRRRRCGRAGPSGGGTPGHR